MLEEHIESALVAQEMRHLLQDFVPSLLALDVLSAKKSVPLDRKNLYSFTDAELAIGHPMSAELW